MTVFVCGDSFMAPDARAPGLHFSEIMGATSLARPGVGNIDICFQIKAAIAQGADRVIIGTTDSGRIELPLDDHEGDIVLGHLRPGKEQHYISDTIPTFIGEEPDLANKYRLSPEQRSAVREYLLHIYNASLKTQTDMWAIGYWLEQLRQRGISYLVLPREFCIYEYARTQPESAWTFHTDAFTQQQAAQQLESHANINT